MKVGHYHFSHEVKSAAGDSKGTLLFRLAGIPFLTAISLPSKSSSNLNQLVLVKERILFRDAVAMYQIKVVPSELATGIDVKATAKGKFSSSGFPV